jgi:cytochrome P450
LLHGSRVRRSAAGASPATISPRIWFRAGENGHKLTNEELTANIILLFGAGHETTVNLIGNGLLALHRNPDQLELLKDEPSLMVNAIEELLRYDLSVQVTSRTTLEGVDEIGGTRSCADRVKRGVPRFACCKPRLCPYHPL